MPDIEIDHNVLADLAQSILGDGHALRFSAPGFSMFPFIRDGDIIDVQPLEGWLPRRMDILVYKNSTGKVVVHRLEKIKKTREGDRLFLRGDAPPNCGEWIDARQALGRVTIVEHAGQQIRLDSHWMRGLAWLWGYTMPLSVFVLRLGIFIRRFFRRSTGNSSLRGMD